MSETFFMNVAGPWAYETRLPTHTCRVELEVRKHGAIGRFVWKEFVVRAEDIDIIRFAQMDANELQGLETRGYRHILRLA